MTGPEPSILEVVIRIVARHFRADAASITAATTALDVKGWDSLSHALLLMRLERDLGVRLDPRAAFQATNVEDLAAMFQTALGKEI